jgi:hypothetical protein
MARYEEKMRKNRKKREIMLLIIRAKENKGKMISLTHNQGVAGSSPAGPTKNQPIIQQNQEKEQLSQKSLNVFLILRLAASDIQFPALRKKTENQNHF